MTRLDAVRLLRARDFARLDRAIRSLQEAVERDVRQERGLSNAMAAFSSVDPAITALLQAWVKDKPDSYAARLAVAKHADALAWAARGRNWSNRTSAEQIDKMRYHLARVALEAEAALRLNPRLHSAVGLLISGAKAGEPEDCALLFERYYESIGASFTARMALAVCLLPRWHGSYKALDTLAEEAEARAGVNPRLSALGGIVAWDRGTAEVRNNPAKAAELYTDALRYGAHPWFLLARSRAYFDRRRYSDALVDIEAVLREDPHDTEALMLRAWNLKELGRGAAAASDIRLVTELDPADQMLASFRRQEVDAAVDTARRRRADGSAETAILRLNEGLALVGEHPEMLYWRGRSKMDFKDPAGALVDLQRAVELDPRHLDAIVAVDYLLSERGRYLDVIGYWTAYLALEPDNGKALLARAKAYVARGDVKPGLEDATTACKAGQQEGCVLVQGLQ